MPDIYIHRNHDLSLEEAHALVDDIAEEIASSFGVKYRKEGDTLVFSRAGANGRIRLGESEIVIEASLGMMLKTLRPVIEAAIEEKLDAHT